MAVLVSRTRISSSVTAVTSSLSSAWRLPRSAETRSEQPPVPGHAARTESCPPTDTRNTSPVAAST